MTDMAIGTLVIGNPQRGCLKTRSTTIVSRFLDQCMQWRLAWIGIFLSVLGSSTACCSKWMPKRKHSSSRVKKNGRPLGRFTEVNIRTNARGPPGGLWWDKMESRLGGRDSLFIKFRVRMYLGGCHDQGDANDFLRRM